ncbi:MAG: C40 family peptidase [Bacillota bacterium]|jgi:cell wall-associated NlpC family hydrolase
MRKVGSVLLISMALTLSGGGQATNNLTNSTSWIMQYASLEQTTAAAATNSIHQGSRYVVKKGDTLWAIARSNSTTVANLKKINSLSSDLLQIGQVLYLGNTGTNINNKANTSSKEKVLPATRVQEKAPNTELIKAREEANSPSRGDNDRINNLLVTSKKYLGTPYVYGGKSPKGFDCSGFTQYVFNEYGIELPRSSREQAKVGVQIARSEIRPGDLLFFNTQSGREISHVGIYLGGNEFIHASQNTGISITPLNKGYYANRLITIRRIFR